MCFYGKIMLRIKLKIQHIMEKKVIAGEKSKKVGRWYVTFRKSCGIQ